jgi:hypothetical protein
MEDVRAEGDEVWSANEAVPEVPEEAEAVGRRGAAGRWELAEEEAVVEGRAGDMEGEDPAAERRAPLGSGS